MSTDICIPQFKDYRTTKETSKAWITPENEIAQLSTFHYEYFADPAIASRYGIEYDASEAMRLAALRVGFVRVNYELNGGIVTIESIRWDRDLRHLIDRLLFANAEVIDMVRINMMDGTGQATQVGCVSFMQCRQYGKEIDRLTLGSWNNFRTVKICNLFCNQTAYK